MKQCTMSGLTSNGAIKRAEISGEYYFRRSNSNRWYVYHAGRAIFGFTQTPATLDTCKKFVAMMMRNK
jgi:hypothetical protein